MDANKLLNDFFHSDFFDNIISHRLKEIIEATVRDIEDYESKDNLAAFQKEDLQNWRKDVECMTHVYVYFSGVWDFDPYEKDDEND
jgi:hypothetical protein